MTTIQIRIDDETKNVAKAIFDEVGLDMSSAIKLFFKKVALVKGLPFSIITENGMTIERELAILKAVKEAEMGVNVTSPMTPKQALAYLRNIRIKSEKKRIKKK